MKRSLTRADFEVAAQLLGCDVASIMAVAEVESYGSGFNPDDTPVTLFEGHKFHQFTDGRFDAKYPTLSYPKWTREHYGKTWQAEQDRLQLAMGLDREAALKSASWGRFQCMGFNHGLAGFEKLQDFVNAMYASERKQLMAFVSFVINTGLAPALRSQDWAAFAAGYNGAGFAKNKYDVKMAAAFDKFSTA